jgi:hypothetical protein
MIAAFQPILLIHDKLVYNVVMHEFHAMCLFACALNYGVLAIFLLNHYSHIVHLYLMYIVTNICYIYVPYACGISTINSFLYGYNLKTVSLSYHMIFNVTNIILLTMPIEFLNKLCLSVFDTVFWPWNREYAVVAVKAHVGFCAIGYIFRVLNIVQ